jgi:hypothetical protein
MMKDFSYRLAWLRLSCVALFVLIILPVSARTQEKPEGTLTWALHFSPAPSFFDPGETPGIATPF